MRSIIRELPPRARRGRHASALRGSSRRSAADAARSAVPNGASDARFAGGAGGEQTIADAGPQHGFHILGSRRDRGLAKQDVYPVRAGRGETFLGLVQPECEPGAAFLEQIPQRRGPYRGAAMYTGFFLIVGPLPSPRHVPQKRRDRTGL